MISRILVANRGEIACRIIRTAARMGIETVAVHSEPDADARHVRLADRRVAIGGDTPASSYLDIDRILAAARRSGAEAVHPGYGFLSENPEFAERTEAAGLVFVGPDAAAIRAMGLKDRARQLMAAAGVPVVPGHDGADTALETLLREAARIGYPVMIKAAAGGGGKGMRRVDRAEALPDALAATRREAAAAFGNDHVILEKCVANPRHVEVQVFADSHGNAVHLFERDCSLQRRHQKVMEEAPAPGMTPETRAAMTEAAVTAARAIGYRGAGTVEFIVDGSAGLRPDGFWFMEMNTRLQVEHPVTEMITGFDLVEWQIRVAAGEPLPALQDEIAIRGHAVEARVYAEDAAAGFLPAPGPLDHAAFPEGVRVDHGIRCPDRVSPFYDPLIAKVICHGCDRADAFARLRTALGGTRIHGTATNLGFLHGLAEDRDVAAMAIDTAWIDRNLNRLVDRTRPDDRTLAIAALVHAAADGAFADNDGWRLWGGGQIPVKFLHGKESAERRLTLRRGAVTVDGGAAPQMFARVARDEDSDCLTVVEDGRETLVPWTDRAGQISLVTNGRCLRIARLDGRRSLRATDGGTRILAPMTGLVRVLDARVGDRVRAGDVLAIMEAMKMEHRLAAPCDGVVTGIGCAAGQAVEDGRLLIELKASDA